MKVLKVDWVATVTGAETGAEDAAALVGTGMGRGRSSKSRLLKFSKGDCLLPRPAAPEAEAAPVAVAAALPA